MNKKFLDYLGFIAKLDITTYHYKILLLLNIKSYNQAQLAEELNTYKQNMHKYMKELEALQLVEVDRIEGRNKFYKAVTDIDRLSRVIPGQTKLL